MTSRWREQYDSAMGNIFDRDARIDEASDLIERNLTLLGCVAIEDKLQEGVPQCISQLAEAGIRIWVLTGEFRLLLKSNSQNHIWIQE